MPDQQQQDAETPAISPPPGIPAQRDATEPPPPAEPPARGRAVTVALATAAVLLLGLAAYHLGTVFLSIAPANPVSQRYQKQIDAHVFPEFEQNWQLFAPNPLQQNIHLQAEVQTLRDGVRADAPWIDLTDRDVAAIRGNPAPSHVNQNLLRRAWDYYTAWHDDQDEHSTGYGGQLGAEYLKRLVLQRIGRTWHGEQIVQVRMRAEFLPVTGPSWTGAAQHPTPSYRTLGWWPVSRDDFDQLSVEAAP